jgi:hypothetical protein
MMSAWIVSIIDGILTGIGLYSLVILRMYFGPIAGRRFGSFGRFAVWVILISAMVILAEFDLEWLRDWLKENHAPGVLWYYEAVYAAIFLVVGLVLVRWRVLRRPAKQGDQSNALRDDKPKSLRRSQ